MEKIRQAAGDKLSFHRLPLATVATVATMYDTISDNDWHRATKDVCDEVLFTALAQAVLPD